MNESEPAAAAATPTDPGNENRAADIPTPDEARDWLKESGSMLPDLTVTWKVTDGPGSMERHLKLLDMLFGPTEPPRAA